MKIYKVATLAAVVLGLVAGSAMAQPNVYPQTPSQIINDLRMPTDQTYYPSNLGG
jgi:hypothetical protein